MTGQESAIPVQAVNINTIQLASGPVPLSDFIAMSSGPNSYELRQGYRSTGEQSWTTALDLAPNRRQTAGISLNPAGEPLDPGLYYLRYDAGPSSRSGLPMLIISSDLQVTFKLSATEALVWVVDLNTNQPIEGAPVVLYDPLGMEIASGLTASDGVFQTDVSVVGNPYDTFYTVISQPGMPDFGMAASTWSQGISPWDFGLQSDYRGPHLEAYLYTDRPIYRPGQTVYFRGVVRQAYDGRYELPDLESLPLTLYQDYGTELTSFDLPLSDFGTIFGEYVLPEEMTPGNYRLASTLSDYDIQVFFDVAEYRKPEINLQVDFDRAQARQGDELGAEISARYFFDAPAGNLKLEWTLLEEPAFFYLPGYRVGVEDFRWLEAFYYPEYGLLFGRPVDQGQAVTDEQGRVRLTFTPEKVDGRARYTLEVTATDESGLPVSGRGSVEVNPGDYYIGVLPDAWGGTQRRGDGFRRSGCRLGGNSTPGRRAKGRVFQSGFCARSIAARRSFHGSKVCPRVFADRQRRFRHECSRGSPALLHPTGAGYIPAHTDRRWRPHRTPAMGRRGGTGDLAEPAEPAPAFELSTRPVTGRVTRLRSLSPTRLNSHLKPW